MGACVPSAMSAVIRLTRPARAPCTAWSSSGSGQLRVASGTITQTLRPSRSTRASWSATKALTSASGRTFSGPPISAACAARSCTGSRVLVTGPACGEPPAGTSADDNRWQPIATCRRGGEHSCVTPSALSRHPDRLLPAEPGVRDIARRLYEAVRDLPILSPHGHVDARILADDVPFADPATLFVTPDHYVTRLLHAGGVPLGDLGVGRTELPEAESRRIWRLLCENWYLFRGTPSRYWLESELGGVFYVA